MKLLKSERGFSLLELLIALGIISIIGGAMAMTTATIVRLTPQSNDQVIALRQAQNAGYWITRDVQAAQTVDINPATGEFLKLTFTVVGSDNSIITYRLEDMAGGKKKLVRISQGMPMLVAEYIYYDPAANPDTSTRILEYENYKISFQITATTGDATVIKKYQASQRVPMAQ